MTSIFCFRHKTQHFAHAWAHESTGSLLPDRENWDFVFENNLFSDRRADGPALKGIFADFARDGYSISKRVN